MLRINPITSQSTNFCSEQKIPYAIAEQSKVIASAMQEVNPSIQKLRKAVHCSGARDAIAAMKERLGVDVIFKEGGLSLFVGDKTIKIFSSNSKFLKIREQSTNNRDDFRYVELQNDKVLGTRGFDSKSDSVEEFLASVFKKLDFPILQLRIFIKRPEIEQVLKKISPKAVLDDNTARITDDIKNLFYEIQERISSISNGTTRSKIKNGYVNARPSIHGAKQLEFSNIGIEKADYSVNIITKTAGQKYLVVKINKDGQGQQVIIVDPKYKVLKEKNLGKVYDLGSNAVYYTQQEIDSPLFRPKLEFLKKELEAYNKYLKEKIVALNEYKAHLSTDEIGIIEYGTLKLIENVKGMFYGCKAKMLKIKDASGKKAFKEKYNISTRDGSPSLIFRNINSANESLHLSFPVMAGEQCMKIIVEKQNGNIGKSFFVNGDKLVKFNATSLGRSKRTENLTHYHSQEEIEQSGLRNYLTILSERLKPIPKS